MLDLDQRGAADFRYASKWQKKRIAKMSHWALTRLFNLSFISIYVVGLLWEESRRRRQAARRPLRPDEQREQEARRLPLVQWGGALLLTSWL
jgi:hypothetical protein